MRKHKISIEKVQEAFNSAIRRRDKRCVVKDYEPCGGCLECSHFYTTGGNPSLRFFPPNAYAQCSVHHRNHHQVSARPYVEYMQTFHQKDLEFMQVERSHYIKYDDELKAEIIRLCNADKLDELTELLQEKLK